MPSDRTALTTLATDLRRLGLNRTADELNDRIRSHDLESYDALGQNSPDDAGD